jgi:hypothetical protein
MQTSRAVPFPATHVLLDACHTELRVEWWSGFCSCDACDMSKAYRSRERERDYAI